MQNIVYKKTDKTPEVIFNYDKHMITITGICAPENPAEFFKPIYSEFANYKKSQSDLIFEIYLEYFNTGASKCLLNLFLQTKENEILLANTSVNWLIEKDDEELMEAGQVFEEITKLKFLYNEIKHN